MKKQKNPKKENPKPVLASGSLPAAPFTNTKKTAAVASAATSSGGGSDLLKSPGLRITHAPGTGPGKHAHDQVWKSPPLFPIKGGAVARFEVMFEPGFEWGCRGKLGGFHVGHGPADGGEHSATGSSLRVMWDAGGGAYLYIYLPTGTESRQPAQLKKFSKYGNEMFKADFAGVFKPGTWHKVELGLKLNTPGSSDGSLSLSIDGKKRELDGVVWRTQQDLNISMFGFGVFHGGPCKATKTSVSNIRNLSVLPV